MIVTRAQVGKDPTATKIAKYLQDHKLEIPLIILGQAEVEDKSALILPDPINWEILIAHAAKFLGVTLNDVAKN